MKDHTALKHRIRLHAPHREATEVHKG